MRKKEFFAILTMILLLFIIWLALNTKKEVKYSEYYIRPDSYHNYVSTPEDYSFEYVINNNEGIQTNYSIEAFFNDESFYKKNVQIKNGSSFTDNPILELTSFKDTSRIELRINDESLWIHLFNKKNEIANVVASINKTLKLIDGTILILPKISFDLKIADNYPKNITYIILTSGKNVVSKDLSATKEFNISIDETGFFIPSKSFYDLTIKLFSGDELLDEKNLFTLEKPEFFVLKTTVSSQEQESKLFGNGYDNQTLKEYDVNLQATNFDENIISLKINLLNLSKTITINSFSSNNVNFKFIGFGENLTTEKASLNIEVFENAILIKNFQYKLNLSEGSTTFLG
ncbi:MAG: hypothetical protein GOU97_02400 [Nanoarchaeota archaeon]|nr:hypothetical protein [Nanoarchaeota archaeon]